MRHSYFGHPFGARVAPQRCPILRKDNRKISDKMDYASFFIKLGMLSGKKNGNFNCR